MNKYYLDKVKFSDLWCTPRSLFNVYDNLHHYTLDVAASPTNNLVDNYYALEKEQNALDLDWHGRVWCNPPYSQTRKFVNKGIEQMMLGNIECVTFLLCTDTTTQVFRAAITQAKYIVFITHRVMFMSWDGIRAIASRGNMLLHFEKNYYNGAMVQFDDNKYYD